MKYTVWCVGIILVLWHLHWNRKKLSSPGAQENVIWPHPTLTKISSKWWPFSFSVPAQYTRNVPIITIHMYFCCRFLWYYGNRCDHVRPHFRLRAFDITNIDCFTAHGANLFGVVELTTSIRQQRDPVYLRGSVINYFVRLFYVNGQCILNYQINFNIKSIYF